MSDLADIAAEREAEYLGDSVARTLRAAALDAPGTADCADCGEPIPPERRRAMPSATRCVPCLELLERVNKNNPRRTP